MTDVHGLVAGSVPAEQFDLLLEGTDIRGVKVSAALKLHLVNGLTPKEACEQTGADRSQFSLRLKSIRIVNDRVARLVKFYAIA
ncbi:PapB/FocB family fimbrial expression transcriptional regulator [Pseudomonas sp. R9.37]|uniref:PapB/FocB family fimbrial expression transcriptional regulator n=1 Tax=Pseudomonas sp. R9.37 TaxID=1390498 RepID=UPI000D0CD1E3|nr:Na(+)-translocating NADH-quinone reductase subunit C [Pseudomonas sp. R9.37]